MSQQPTATTGVTFVPTKAVVTALLQTSSAHSQKSSLGWVKQIIGKGALIGLSFSLLASGSAEAVSFSFRKVVDTNTPIPGGTGNFDGFGDYSLDDGNIAFTGVDFDSNNNGFSITQGVYTSMDGKLSVVADSNTPIPGGTNFDVFANLDLDGKNLAFKGEDQSARQQGIYTSRDGKLSVIADTNTPVPGGNGNFYRLDFPSLDDKDLAFQGGVTADLSDSTQGGIYTSMDGKLSVIADTNTAIPSGVGNFEGIAPPSLVGKTVAISGGNGSNQQYGVYTSTDGKLSVIADTNTPIPGGTENFRYLTNPFPNNGSVVFWGSPSTAYEGGIYMSKDGKLNVIVDTNTPVPGGSGTFTTIQAPITSDNGNVAFVGTDSFGQEGIYTNLGGRLSKVFKRGDLLDGSRMTGFDPLAGIDLSGNEIAFTAVSEERVTEGIYVATAVPEPSSVLGTLALEMFGAGWMLKRRLRKHSLAGRAESAE